MDEQTVRATPAHLWVVGVLALLWNSFGGYDYTMTQTRNPAYLAKFPAEVMAYVDAAPGWFVAAWALGVWGALAGSVLLLMRSRHAVLAFLVSLAGLAVTSLNEWVLNPAPAEMRGGVMLMVQLLIWLIAITLFLYARRMRVQRVLN